MNEVHANIVLIGDPKQLDAVTKSKWSTKLGFKISWLEHLFNLPLYQRNEKTGEFNQTYITQLVKNYRSHSAILTVPNELFYENKLEAMIQPGLCIKNLSLTHTYATTLNTDSEIIQLDLEGLLSKNFPIIFRSIQGDCQTPLNQTRYLNEFYYQS